jgi:asparagine synthase (glutamine-hydrolysing)
MRVSLEARVPLLDLEALELAARIPARWRVRDGRPKYLLRRLVARRMGEEFVARRKQGFRLPELSWFRAMPREKLESSLFAAEGIEEWLDPARLRGLLLESPRGLELAWPFLAFAAWLRSSGGTP